MKIETSSRRNVGAHRHFLSTVNEQLLLSACSCSHSVPCLQQPRSNGAKTQELQPLKLWVRKNPKDDALGVSDGSEDVGNRKRGQGLESHHPFKGLSQWLHPLKIPWPVNSGKLGTKPLTHGPSNLLPILLLCLNYQFFTNKLPFINKLSCPL